MENQETRQLSEPLKAILIKVATEMKRYKWIANKETSEIDAFQGHIPLQKSFHWDGSNDSTVGVDVTADVDLTLTTDDAPVSWYIIYKAQLSLYVDQVGGSDAIVDGDLNVGFTEQDINNTQKIQLAAKTLDAQLMNSANEEARDYSLDSFHDSQAASRERW